MNIEREEIEDHLYASEGETDSEGHETYDRRVSKAYLTLLSERERLEGEKNRWERWTNELKMLAEEDGHKVGLGETLIIDCYVLKPGEHRPPKSPTRADLESQLAALREENEKLKDVIWHALDDAELLSDEKQVLISAYDTEQLRLAVTDYQHDRIIED